MNKISALVAKIGTNAIWIAANAHFWFAFSLMLMAEGRRWMFVSIILTAAAKEFYFDARNEVPKQTTFDNVTDFAGYAAGAILGSSWVLLTN